MIALPEHEPSHLQKNLLKKAERMQDMLERVRRQKGFESPDLSPDFSDGEERVVHSEWLNFQDALCEDYFTVMSSWVRGAFMMECLLRLKGPFPIRVTWAIQELKTEVATLYRGRYTATPSLYGV